MYVYIFELSFKLNINFAKFWLTIFNSSFPHTIAVILTKALIPNSVEAFK
jgi:hypothetical protein